MGPRQVVFFWKFLGPTSVRFHGGPYKKYRVYQRIERHLLPEFMLPAKDIESKLQGIVHRGGSLRFFANLTQRFEFLYGVVELVTSWEAARQLEDFTILCIRDLRTHTDVFLILSGGVAAERITFQINSKWEQVISKALKCCPLSPLLPPHLLPDPR